MVYNDMNDNESNINTKMNMNITNYMKTTTTNKKNNDRLMEKKNNKKK